MTRTQLDIDVLIDELTLSEKISLLAGKNLWQTHAIDRLEIPSVTVSDGPNGVRGTRFFNGVPSNCFPCGTGMAATFNKDLMREAGELMSKEAKMKSVHCILGPTCNIARGPLGGRAFESYSEDPYLLGHMAAAVVNGIQSKNVVACLKHFVCNDQEHERRAVDLIVTERALREVYLKPFEITVRDAGPKAIMTAYNKVNGEHALQLKRLLHDVLRTEWGWEGMLMSDWYGVYSTRRSLEAGLNLEMPGPTRFREDTITQHKIISNEMHADVIDFNVRKVLEFVNNCLLARIPPDQDELENKDPAAGRLLRKIGGESLVLLKNDGILPLSAAKAPGNETIAVIGPNAKARSFSGGGSASLRPRYTVTPFEGIVNKIREKAGSNGVVVDYALGAFLSKTLPNIGSLTVDNYGKPGFTVKFFMDPPESARRKAFDEIHCDTSRLFLNDYKSEHLPAGEQLYYCDIEGSYTADETLEYWIGCLCLGTAQIFLDDKLVVDNKTHQVKGDDFFLGLGTREERSAVRMVKGQMYKIRVEFGTRPTSKIPSHMEVGGVFFGLEVRTTLEKALAKAVEVAKKADKVVLVTGLTAEWESEGFDRPDMDVPGWTDRLVAEVAKVNKNVVVVNQSGSPVTMPWVGAVSGLVQAWYGGNELGNAIADVLFGDVTPSGRLSLSFPEKLQHNPSYLNFGSTNGRVLYGEDVFVGYRYYEKVGSKPLFPFGFGLSYTTFDVKNVAVAVAGDEITVTADVSNTGSVAGAEVVQVYVQPTNPSVIRPVKELRDFAKVHLEPGETKAVSVVLLKLDATSYWDTYKGKWLSEKDTYKVLVGTSSDNIVGEAEFATKRDVAWLGKVARTK